MNDTPSNDNTMSLTNVITDPDESFRKRAENPGLLRPLGIVFLAAIASVLAPLLTYRAFVAAGAPPLASLSLAGGVVFGFFGQFVAWVIFALVFYLLSIAVGGEGSLGDTFKLNGWGFAPAIIAGIVSAIAQFHCASKRQCSQSPTKPQFRERRRVLRSTGKLSDGDPKSDGCSDRRTDRHRAPDLAGNHLDVRHETRT